MEYNKFEPESPEDIINTLNYEYHFSFSAMGKIILAAVSLITGIACFVLFTHSFVGQLIGAFGFSIFIRLVMGSPYKRRLTTESAQKLDQWLHLRYHRNDDTTSHPQ